MSLTLDTFYDDLWLQNWWTRRVYDKDWRFNTMIKFNFFILTLQPGYTLW